MYKSIFLVLSILFMGGCGYIVPTHKHRIKTIQKLTNSNKLTKEIISAGIFKLYSIHSNLLTCKGTTINLYIEGDGLPWVTSTKISDDPTPINPLGLKLFLKDNHKCKVYLARPCQYISSSTCKNRYWTSHRFSSEVIDSLNIALDKIKKRSNAFDFKLFGYSGGGAVAALLAAKRDDIVTLVTIAGVLDEKYWTKEHYVTPLYGSLNPADFSEKLSKIYQIHLIGEKDSIVDFSVFQSYIKKFKDKSKINYKIFRDYNHHCCWEKNWKYILKDIK